MIAPLDRYINVPNIAEGLAVSGTGGLIVPIALNGGTGTTVISNVSCIHAREIVVMVKATAQIDHVYLDIYAGSRSMVASVDLGNVGAGATTILQYLLGAGQTYDVRLVPSVDPDVAQAWTAAR